MVVVSQTGCSTVDLHQRAARREGGSGDEERALLGYADEVVARSRGANQVLLQLQETEVDDLLREICDDILLHAAPLAQSAVGESGYGNEADRVTKISLAAQLTFASLAGKVGHGVVRVDEPAGIMEIATPVGVVLALVPVTNPVATVVHNVGIALKGRNSVILSPHHAVQKTVRGATEMVREALRRRGLPEDLVQCIEKKGRHLVQALMGHQGVAMILATGGPGMVHAAYSSGTPAIGVGAGNAPVVICADADINDVAQKIVESKSFDNGLICGAENNILVFREKRQQLEEALARHGAAVLSLAEMGPFTEAVTESDGQELRKEFLGKSAAYIAKKAGIARDYSIRLLVVPVDALSALAWKKEKLCPLVSLRSVDDLGQAIVFSNRLLDLMGRGHTAVIHTRDLKVVEQFGLNVRASRVLVNDHAAFACMGKSNNLDFSLVLGCGTLGGGSTPDNVTYTHLINIRRIALPASCRFTEK